MGTVVAEVFGPRLLVAVVASGSDSDDPRVETADDCSESEDEEESDEDEEDEEEEELDDEEEEPLVELADSELVLRIFFLAIL